MQTADGHELRSINHNQCIQVTPCTRWVELQGALKYHLQLAALLQTTTLFRMLNPPGKKVGPQEFTVGPAKNDNDDNDDDKNNNPLQLALQVIQNATPRGVTPLTQHLQYIKMHIQSVQGMLRSKGQEAVIVLATDGLPSNALGESSQAVLQEFLLELKAVQRLPVWIVIRLCTDDDRVVEYYNNLDKEVSE